MARAPVDEPPDTDLVSSHFAAAEREAWLRRLIGFTVILAVCGGFSWFILSSGSAGYASLMRWTICISPAAAAEGCPAPQPPPLP